MSLAACILVAAIARPAAAQSLAFPSQIPVPAQAAAEIRAYDALGRVACKTCPSGFRDEGEPTVMLADRLKASGIDMNTRLSRIQPQQGTAWSGSEVSGMLIYEGEGSVAGFPCKRFRYSISRGDRRAEKDRLICWGRKGPGVTKEEWVTVY